MYKIYIDNKQNDYRRYISHAQYYTSQDLSIASIRIKNELKKNLAFMPNEKGVDDVFVNILNSEQYKAYVVFSFAQSDVYFRLDYTPENGDMWSALINRGEQNINNTNQSFPNENEFEQLCAKPLKLLVIMYYDELIHFIGNESARLKNSHDLITDLVKQVQDELNKVGTMEEVQNTSYDSTRNVEYDMDVDIDEDVDIDPITTESFDVSDEYENIKNVDIPMEENSNG